MASVIPDNTALKHQFEAVKFHDVSERTLPSGRKQTFDTPSPTDQLKTVKDAFEKHPLTVRRIILASGEQRTSLKIRSEHILHCLTQTFNDHDDVSLVGKPVILSNFLPFVHRFKDIWAYTYDNQRTEEELQHLEKLLAFVCNELEDEIRIFRQVEESCEVSYNNLWASFVPGETVVAAQNDYTECYKVLACSKGEESFSLRCHQYNYAAGFRGYRTITFNISPFGGLMSIAKLPFVPLQVTPDADRIRSECIEQGKLWWRVVGGLHCAYEGIAFVAKTKGSSRWDRSTVLEHGFIGGKVMIDLQAFDEANPGFRPKIDVDTRIRQALAPPSEDILDESQARMDSTLTDEEALLCPATASGFAFQAKAWAKFTVRGLKPIVWQKGLWKGLSMDEDRKQYIWELTRGHDWALNVPADQKDLGLKYLLHGRSGSGKSLTVESLADETKSPLFVISEQDLKLWSESGDYSYDYSLQHAFKCAYKWKALLFIDEADNFVIRNDNSYFMAFLRQVEFFRGILFLATNKSEKSFDAAVLGRVDVRFYYDCSSSQRKTQMWRKLLLRTTLSPDEASHVAETIGQKYVEVDYRVISKLIKLARLLATSKGTSFGLTTLEEAMVLHNGRPLEETMEKNS